MKKTKNKHYLTNDENTMTNVCNALIIIFFSLNKKVQVIWMMFNEEKNNGKLKTMTDFVEMGGKTNHKWLEIV